MNTLSSLPLDPSAAAAGTETPARSGWWQRVVDAVLSTDPRRRIRIVQWLISNLVYLVAALVLWFGIRHDGMYVARLLGWCAYLVIGQAGLYAALRSGWSERFGDPALTAAQIVLAVVVVEWGYLIAGPVRSIALFPLLLIFAFGAFSLSRRRIMRLTAFALVSLVACMAALHATRPGVGIWSLDNPDLHLDLTNALIIMIVLPAMSMVAARLSALRSKLRAQRAALTQALKEVQRLATHDELTGLANRRHMQERLTQEQGRFKRTGHAFSIAVIDLDHFKQVNDRHGHAGGDEVLRAFANEATSMLRGCDLLARWGGEEFLLLLPGTPGAPAQASVERLLAGVLALHQDSGQPLSFSAGVAEYLPGEAVSETVARADRNMYEAKRSGRSTVICNDAAPDRDPAASVAANEPGTV